MNPILFMELATLSLSGQQLTDLLKYSSPERESDCIVNTMDINMDFVTKTPNLTPMDIAKITLQSFLDLPANWNTYGALPFPNSLIEKANNILVKLTHTPSVFPTGRNSIQFEYEKENGDYLEFEIYTNRIEYLEIRNFIEKEGEIKALEVNKLVKSFYA